MPVAGRKSLALLQSFSRVIPLALKEYARPLSDR
jgi:hypothetical protein